MNDRVLEGPFSPAEYGLLVCRRKTGLRSDDQAERDWFEALTRRYHALFPSNLERISWHEAGHAMVAHRLGWWVDHIERFPHHEGKAAMAPPPEGSPYWPQGRETRLRDWATVKVAGYMAENRVAANVDPAEASPVAYRLEELKGYTPAQCLTYVEEVEGRALRILVADWAAVGLLADALKASAVVERDALASILGNVGVGGVL